MVFKTINALAQAMFELSRDGDRTSDSRVVMIIKRLTNRLNEIIGE
jgi:hypothetical protein